MIVGRNMRDGNVMLVGPFVQANVTDSQSAVALSLDLPSVASIVGIEMPAAGYVIGTIAEVNAAVTAGTITCIPTIDTTALSGAAATDIQAILNTTDTLHASGRATTKGVATFTAGQSIGVKITTDADLEPNTTDLVVWVVVGLNEVCTAD